MFHTKPSEKRPSAERLRSFSICHKTFSFLNKLFLLKKTMIPDQNPANKIPAQRFSAFNVLYLYMTIRMQ